MKKKVLLTRPLSLSEPIKQKLRESVDIIMSPNPTEESILALASSVHGIIAHGTGVTKAIIDSAPSLEMIATPQVGFDGIDVAAATEAGVAVIANTGVSPETVAEFTLGLMIALSRRIVRADHDLRQKKDWAIRGPYLDPSGDMGNDLRGATVGLVGFGSIGSAVAHLCQAAFSARVLAFDPFVSRAAMSARRVEKRKRLLELARVSDFLCLHMPLNAETKHMIDESILRAMKPGAYLINCARGPVVDEEALIAALQNRWIAGAALDVFEIEPLSPGNPLLNLDNVILTPHIAGITVRSSAVRQTELVKRVIAFFAGRRPVGLVNPEVWPERLRKAQSQEPERPG